MYRICATSFQAALKPQSNCIKDQSKKKKKSRSISFRLNTRFYFGSTFGERKEDIDRDLSQHLLTSSIQPMTYSPGFSPHSQ